MTPSNQPVSQPTDPKQSGDAPRSQQPTTVAEWVSLTISSLLLAGVLALVGYLWANDRQRQPPILRVTQSEIRQAEGTFYVPFEVTNAGGKTAESVQVIAELQINGVTVESGEQILDFLASEEQAEGAFVFSRDPQQGELIIRVASYQNP